MLDRFSAVGQPNQQWLGSDGVDVADEQQARSIGQTYSALVIAEKPFPGEGLTSQVLTLQLVIAQQHAALGSEYLHVAVEQEDRLRMIVVFLVEYQASVGGKGKQALGGFNVLYFGVVQLAGQLPILQDRCGEDKKQQHQSEYADIPQCEAMTDVVIS